MKSLTLCGLVLFAFPDLGHADQTAQITLVADFERFSEGGLGSTVTDGGITFSDLVRGSHWPLPGSTFYADYAPPGILPAPFTSGNVLKAGGYSPNSVSFGVFTSMRVTFDGLASSASADVYGTSRVSENVLLMQGWLNGDLVATDTLSFSGPGNFSHQFGYINAPAIDEVRFLGVGPFQEGSVFVVFDNVTITLIPEPSTWVLGFIGLGAFLITQKRPR